MPCSQLSTLGGGQNRWLRRTYGGEHRKSSTLGSSTRTGLECQHSCVHHVLGSDKRVETHSSSGSSFRLVIFSILEASPFQWSTHLSFHFSFWPIKCYSFKVMFPVREGHPQVITLNCMYARVCASASCNSRKICHRQTPRWSLSPPQSGFLLCILVCLLASRSADGRAHGPMLFTKPCSLNFCFVFVCFLTNRGFLDSSVDVSLESCGKNNVEFWPCFLTNLMIPFETCSNVNLFWKDGRKHALSVLRQVFFLLSACRTSVSPASFLSSPHPLPSLLEQRIKTT